MFALNLKKWMTVCGIAAAMSTPASATACCWWDSLFGRRAQTTYLPVQPACQPQTCGYAPQTCYRTVYSNVPVTQMQAVSTTDPCTGCPVTSYRPITTYVRRPQLVPVTTYQPVAVAAPACSPCGTAVASPCATGGCAPAPSGTPYYQSGAVASPCGPGGCGQPTLSGPVTPTPTYATPTYATPSPAPTVAQPGIPTYTNPPSAAPSLAPLQDGNTTGSGPTTFSQPSAAAPTTSNYQATPIPDTDNTPANSSGSGEASSLMRQNSTPAPRLFDPNNRTTARPVLRAWAYQPINYPAAQAMQASNLVDSPSTTAITPATATDNDGWRAGK